MDNAMSNTNSKIWLFWNKDCVCNLLDQDEQQLTCKISHAAWPKQYLTTFVYAKCKDYMRRDLWDKMLQFSDREEPWCTIGDFNVITHVEEKMGGQPYNMNKSFEFISVIEACGLTDLGFHGQQFTWCNKRDADARIWKRLDRAMVNDAWLEAMPVSTLNHLASTGSDHCPLLLECTERQSPTIKYFKFLHCWAENENFIDTVRSCWERPVDGNPMRTFHQKLKRVSNTLSHWSRKQYGDIFASVKEFEEQVIQAEENIINDNSKDNRAKLNQINAQGRRRRLFIHQISDEQGNSIQGDDNIASAACAHFEKLFTAEEKQINEDVIKCIPRIVTDQQNELLHSIPTKEELKEVVFSMSPTSAAGPDGMSGKFFHSCWDIICDDLLKLVQHFFNGHCIPKYISHACLVLLPKTEHPNKLSEYRPISLSNFTSKIISKLLCLRLAPILPQLISDNQSGFVKGAEVLSRMLNNLNQHYLYTGFHMERKGPQVNHLSFADDVIIFTATNNFSMTLITKTLKVYETTSGQLINKDKSQFMLPLNTNPDIIDRIGRITGFKCTHGPITYLGCPLYIGRQRIIYYTGMVSKVISKIRGWQNKILSFGGRATLVKSVLQSLPIYLLSAIRPTATTINQIKSLIANFFWGFWWDDWLGIGPLAYHNNHLPRLNNSRVSDYMENGEWNVQKIRKYAPPQLVQQILSTEVDHHSNTDDQACWKLTSHGNFTSKSAWEIVRKKRAKTLIDRCTWHANIPFKASFLLWRAVRQKLPTNDKIVQFGAAPALMGNNPRDLLTEKHTDEVVDCQVQYHATLSHGVELQQLSNNTWSNYSTSTAGGGSFNSRSSLLVGFNFAGTMFKDQQPTIDLHQLNNINCKSSITSAEVNVTNHQQQQPNINNISQRKPPTLNKYIRQHQENPKLGKITANTPPAWFYAFADSWRFNTQLKSPRTRSTAGHVRTSLQPPIQANFFPATPVTKLQQRMEQAWFYAFADSWRFNTQLKSPRTRSTAGHVRTSLQPPIQANFFPATPVTKLQQRMKCRVQQLMGNPGR
ncbi:uncharacterized protein LOC129890541 [Solanum dulcamara]|uniref:uncharacterized protein LOC129890541 n=1 Tax=Solanum dulcamara TaxID=45834 RepID=UPI002486AF7E|nr:uncharacterized protein LOC129890541 [Solanum dulcamara]